MRTLVTGGAGFIGSHAVDALLDRDAEVICFDDFSTGRLENLALHQDSNRLRIARGDVADLDSLKTEMQGCDAVWHFQANADVRGGIQNTRIDLEQNTIATWNVLEAARLCGVREFVFASSATIYGEPETFPTPECEPKTQTSLYGASKLAGEAMLEAFAGYFEMRARTFRFVSFTGPRYRHGAIVDFVRKLRQTPQRLEILGDGTQRKSYLDVRDGIRAMALAAEKTPGPIEVFNLGHESSLTVLDLAAVVISELGLRDVEIIPGSGKRGWIGDSPLVQLDTTKIRSLGWTPEFSIEQSVRETVRFLLDHPALLEPQS